MVKMVTMTGFAPDGSDLVVGLDVELPDYEMCTVVRGMAYCTLPAKHPGPWHIATTEEHIVAVWAVDS